MNRFPNNSRVCFVGDSITHANRFVMHIVSYYKRNFPKANINFYNCGISGSTITEHLKVIESDTLAYNPTHVVIMIGINDSERGWLSLKRSSERYQNLKTAFEKYKANLSTLCDIFKSRDIDITLCTCVPYDEYGEYCTRVLPGGTGLIMSYNEYIRNYARENGFSLCDYYPYMIEKMQTERLYDEDSVHPLDDGHYYIGKAFLEYQGLCLDTQRQLSGKIEEWNDCVQKLRDLLACESMIIRNFFLDFPESKKAVDDYLKDSKNDNAYLRGLAERYLINKPIEKEIESRMLEIMEKEL